LIEREREGDRRCIAKSFGRGGGKGGKKKKGKKKEGKKKNNNRKIGNK
jgi:hypothetical protein